MSLVVSLVVWNDAEGQVFMAGLKRVKFLLYFRGGNETFENMSAGVWVVRLGC